MANENHEDTNSTKIMRQNENLRILVVDDDNMIRDMLKEAIEPEGFIVEVSSGSGDALEKLIDYKYNLLLLDANLPGISGFELLKYCKKHHPIMEIIMITGNPELDDAISTVKDGAFDYIAKPFSLQKLIARIKDAIAHQKESLIKMLSLKDASSDPSTGSLTNILPDYKVLRTLGTGTMGVVLLVEKAKKKYALKLLRKDEDNQNHAARLKRFIREAKILKEIEHPNIVRVFDFGFPQDSENPYILMEYVPGSPLTDFIKKENTISLAQKLKIISQIASALATVHKYSILHRDVKPSNILINEEGNAKLTDFGIARVTDSSLTMTHEVLGSPAYMPPEAFKASKIIDPRSDIFSLGVLSYELITGRKPFQGETVAEMVEAIQHSRPLEPRKIIPDLPMPIQNIIEKMLRKNQEDRFSDANKVALAVMNLDKKGDETEKNILGILKNIVGSNKVWS